MQYNIENETESKISKKL